MLGHLAGREKYGIRVAFVSNAHFSGQSRLLRVFTQSTSQSGWKCTFVAENRRQGVEHGEENAHQQEKENRRPSDDPIATVRNCRSANDQSTNYGDQTIIDPTNSALKATVGIDSLLFESGHAL